MKKLIYILFLFITSESFGQVTLTFATSSQTATPGADVTIISTTYTANRTYIFLVGTYRSGATPSDDPTISSGSLTLTKRGTIAGDFNNRLIVYTADVGSSDVTTVITFTYAESQATKIYSTYYYTTLNGVSYNVVGASNTTANPTLTLPTSSNASVVMFAVNNQDPFGGTAEAGWTEDYDAGNAVPVGRYGMRRSNTSDNTPTITAAASNWTALGLQIIRSRRVISSN